MKSPAEYFNKCVILRSTSLREMPMLQQTNTTKGNSTKICTIPQLPLCEERMQREVNMGHPLGSRLHIDYSTVIIRFSFTQQMILIVALWIFFHGESQWGPEL